MKFESSLIKGTLIKRYKRFLADVTLENGSVVTVHVANPGSMLELAKPGTKIWLEPNNNPKRKLKYSWKLIEIDNTFIGVDTNYANKVVKEALDNKTIDINFDKYKSEVKYGENSRIDFLLYFKKDPEMYLEVKSVTLQAPQSSLGYFPDTISTRAHKHCRELMHVLDTPSNLPQRAVMLYLVQHTGINQVSPATHIDPTYAQLVAEAKSLGVEFLAYNCKINQENILINQELNFIM